MVLFVDHKGACVLNELGYHRDVNSYRDVFQTRYYAFTIARFPMSIPREDLSAARALLDEAKSIFFEE